VLDKADICHALMIPPISAVVKRTNNRSEKICMILIYISQTHTPSDRIGRQARLSAIDSVLWAGKVAGRGRPISREWGGPTKGLDGAGMSKPSPQRPSCVIIGHSFFH
jgi:hypothetical protein